MQEYRKKVIEDMLETKKVKNTVILGRTACIGVMVSSWGSPMPHRTSLLTAISCLSS
jgi:hypothetical protein